AAVGRGETHQLDGGPALVQTIGAPRQPYLRHPSGADELFDLPWSETQPDEIAHRRGSDQERSRRRVAIRLDECQQPHVDGGLPLRQLGQPGTALLFIQLHPCVEVRKRGTGDLVRVHCICSKRKARALRQSRFTVGTDTSSCTAMSSSVMPAK